MFLMSGDFAEQGEVLKKKRFIFILALSETY